MQKRRGEGLCTLVVVLSALAGGAGVAGTGLRFDREICPNRLNGFGRHEVLAVNWEDIGFAADAPSSGFVNLPEGCICLSAAESAAGCTLFKCRETCNLNLGRCDEFCCDDPDCTAADVERFKAVGTCLSPGNVDKVVRCTDTSSLAKINAKFNMYVETDDDPFSALLCVAIDNDPFKGEYFEPQVGLLRNPGLLDSASYRPDFSFEENDGLQVSEDQQQETYLPGTKLATAINDGSLVNIWGGFLSLPTSGVNGECLQENFVRFGEDVKENSCVNHITDVKSACDNEFGLLSRRLYTELIRVGTLPNTKLNAPTNSWVATALGKEFHRALDTGKIVHVSETMLPTLSPAGAVSFSPTATPTEKNVTLVNVTNVPSSAPAAAPSVRRLAWNEATQVCENAVVGAHFKISHNGAGEISGVIVDLTVSDIPHSGNETLGVSQDFTIEFINTASLATSNPPARSVSGNPGYITGLALQAGLAATLDSGTENEKTAVRYVVNGLEMLAPAGPRGECFLLQEGTVWWDVIETESVSSTPLLFGIDAVSSCSVELTFEDFQDITSWCFELEDTPIFKINADRVGIYGNANPSRAWEWLEIARDTSRLLQTRPSPSPGTFTCQDIVDRINIEVMWTKSGERTNPQPMILNARIIPEQSNWIWRKTPSPGEKQTFTFSHSVTFIEHKLAEDDIVNYKPEVPPIIPAIPADVFYPFDIVSAATQESGKPSMILISIVSFCALTVSSSK